MGKLIKKKYNRVLHSDEKQSKPWLFKKGQSGNPSGKPKMSDSEKELRKKKGREWCESIAKILDMKQIEFTELVKKSKAKTLDMTKYTVLQIKVVQLISICRTFKDFDVIMSRVIGKSLNRNEIDMQQDLNIRDKRKIDRNLVNNLDSVRDVYEADLNTKDVN